MSTSAVQSLAAGRALVAPVNQLTEPPSAVALSRWRAQLDLPLPLKSWTRTVPAVEALALIDAATPGMEHAAWLERAEALLPQPEPSYRQTLTRLVERLFIQVEQGVIVEAPLLKLLQGGTERRRHDLYYAAYGLAHPWTLLACRQVLLPLLDRLGDAATVSIEDWDHFVLRFGEPDATEASRRKTRSTVIGVLQQLGVLERDTNSAAPTKPRRGAPDASAFGWALADQLALELWGEATLTWASQLSDAAMLYCLRPEAAVELTQGAIRARVLKKAEVAGAPGVAISAAWGLKPLIAAAS